MAQKILQRVHPIRVVTLVDASGNVKLVEAEGSIQETVENTHYYESICVNERLVYAWYSKVTPTVEERAEVWRELTIHQPFGQDNLRLLYEQTSLLFEGLYSTLTTGKGGGNRRADSYLPGEHISLSG
jgi:hypothetical protein